MSKRIITAYTGCSGGRVSWMRLHHKYRAVTIITLKHCTTCLHPFLTMSEVTNPTHLLITNRVADFLLCTFEPLNCFATVANCVLAFKTLEEIEQLKNDLVNDPFDRFIFTEEEGELLIGLKYLTEAGQRIQQAVEGWRVRILLFLERAKSPVELGRIAVHVARPDNIPSSFKLKDILNADKLGRFSVHGSVDRLLVSRNLSAAEIEESRQLWRDQNHNFLFAQPRDITLAVLGNNVPRPANLPKHDNKLIDVLSTDPERRFYFIQRSPAETMVRVKLTEAQREQLSEVWRVKVINYLLPKGGAVLLSEVGANVKRPSIHFGTVATLREVLLEDPHHRFHLFGHGLMLQVVLVPSPRVVPELVPPAPLQLLPLHKSRVGGSGDWRGNESGMNAESSLTAMLRQSSRAVQVMTTEAMTSGRFVTQPRFNPAASHSPAYRYQHQQEAPGTTDLHPFRAPSPGRSSALDNNTKAWDVAGEALRLKNLSDDFSDLFSLPTRVATTPYSSPIAGSVKGLPVVARPATVLSSPLHIPLPVPLTGSVKGSPVGERPAADRSSPVLIPIPAVAPAAGASALALSVLHPPLLPVDSSPLSCSPDSVQHSTSPSSISYSKSSSSGSRAMRKKNNSTDTLLSEWLPMVLMGFSTSLIDTAVNNLREEGFASVRDLVVAKSLGQLSPDYLAQLGLKMGHCNRIFAQLPDNI